MAMHVEHLMTFSAVVTQRSFTRAAYTLGLSQSAVSQQIKELENYFGQPLFERTTRRLALTPAGERLLSYSSDIVGRLHDAKLDISTLNSADGGQLSIGATATIAVHVLPSILADFQHAMAHVRLSIRVAPVNDLQNALASRDFEVLLSPRALPGKLREEYCHEVFATDELVPCVASSHPWVGADPIDPAELLTGRLIAHPQGTQSRELLGLEFERAGLGKPQVALELGNTEAIKRAVEAGLGYGFVSRCALAQELALGKLVEIEIRGLSVKRDLWLISQGEARRSEAAETFRRLVLVEGVPRLQAAS